MKFELYSRRTFLSGRQWRWRLRGRNGRILAHSGEGYFNRADALRSIALVQSTTPANEIVEVD